MAFDPITWWQIDGETMETVTDFIFLCSKITAMVTVAMKLKDACSLEEKLWPTFTAYKKQRLYFANKGPSSQSYSFSYSHVKMPKFDHKEGWEAKNWCFRIVVLEKTLESHLDCKEIKPVNPKGNQPWIFIRRTDAEAPIILWPLDKKIQLIGKDSDSGNN